MILSALPKKTRGWADQKFNKNGAGLYHSHHYGFGILDATKFVAAATKWTKIDKPFRVYETKNLADDDVSTDEITKSVVIADVGGMKIIEQVIIEVTLETPGKRGDVEISFYCPESSLESKLATRRKFDESDEGFKNWKFSTVRCFGENVGGEYKIEMRTKSMQEIKLKYLKLKSFAKLRPRRIMLQV